MSPHSDSLRRPVSSVCSYTPEEIVVAAGFALRRVIPGGRPSQADAYMHTNTCPYVKSLFASALKENIGGIVFPNCCDGMRRLHDVWKEYVKSVPSLFFDVPKKKDTASIEFFASELRRFAENLEKEFGGSRVTDERLNKAITECNTIRRLMNDVSGLLKDVNSDVRGLSVFNLCLEGMTSPASEFAGRLRGFLSNSRNQKAAGKEPRIVLTGNVVHRSDLIALIETLGGRIVVLDTCIALRHYDTLVEEKSRDPMLSLAKRYLQRASCARMEGIEERFQRLRKLADDSGANGVIYSVVKFCDNSIYDAPLVQAAFDQLGIPVIVLENDYEWSGIEQMRTRLEAFLAIAAERG